MDGRISILVAPYALFDVVKALNNTNDKSRRIDFTVTKEDGELVVLAKEVYKGERESYDQAVKCSQLPTE